MTKRHTMRAVAAALLIGTGLLGCGSPEEKAQEYLASAQKFVAEGDLAKADIELRNALKLNPQLAEAHYLRAKVFEARKAMPEMFRELQTAIQIQPEHLEANLLLAQVHVAARQLDDAQAALDRARKLAPDDPRVMRTQAQLHAREDRLEEALAETRAVLEKAPGDLDAQILLGGLLLQTKQFEAALQAIDAGLVQHPDAEALRLLKFQYHSMQSQVDEAAAAMQELITLQPDKLAWRQALAVYLVRNQRAEQAEAILRKAVAELPDDRRAKLALASFLAINDTDAAAKALQGYIEAGGESTEDLQLALAELYAQQGDLDEAAEVYRAVSGSEDRTGALLARNQLARIAWKQGKSEESAQLIEQILQEDPGNADALVSRAGIRVSERRTEEAIADLREALDQEPTMARAHVLLALAHLQNGSTELAKASFIEALKHDPANEEAAVQLAGLLMRERRFDKVLEVLQPLTTGTAPSQRAQGLALQARLALKDWQAADELAGQLGEQADNPEYRRYVGALALQAQGKHAEAIKAFNEVLAAQPRMTGALAGIARSYRELDQAAQGMQAIDAFVATHPEDFGARQLLATELLRDGNTDAARKALEDGLAKDPKWMTGYRGLGIVANREGKVQDALAAYDRALAAKPDDVEFQLLAASALERSDDRTRAEARYREVLKAAPTSDVAANNLAVLLAGDGSDAARLQEAATLAQRFENTEQPYFADTYAWIVYLQGNHAKSAQILDRVVKAAPEEAIFRYHLGAALFQLNDRQSAKLHLVRAEKLAETKGKFEGYDEAMALLAQIQ